LPLKPNALGGYVAVESVGKFRARVGLSQYFSKRLVVWNGFANSYVGC
jgi:hypothetical protein